MAGSDINTSIKYRCRHLLRGMWLLAGAFAVFYLVVPAGHKVNNDSFFLKFFHAMGEPHGVEYVFGFDHNPAFTWVTAGVLMGCAAFLVSSRRALGIVPDVRGFTQATSLVIALILSGIVYSMTFVSWENRALGLSPSITQLQSVRAQLELYQVQHNGDYPALDQLWRNLVNQTEVDGTIGDGSGDEFGPYLQNPPVNKWSNDSMVAADNSGSWVYDEKTAEFRIVIPPHITDMLDEPRNNSDIVAAPYEWAHGTREPLAGFGLVVFQIKESWKALRMTPLVVAVAFVLFYVTCMRLLPKVIRHSTFYDNTTSVLAVIGAIAIALVCIVILEFGRDTTQTIGVTCGFAFLWSFGCRVHLLYHPHYCAGWSDGSFCLFCGYNLKGTRDAGRDVCPECGKQSSALHTASKQDQCREAA